MESFKPESLNIKSIFKNDDVIYKVPNYQRRYGWKDEQLDALWGDLYESYQNKVECYFLGSIVVVKNKSTFELIDGQQRLTTLMIMTSVLNATYPDIECADPDGDDADVNTIDSQIFNDCIFYNPAKGKKRLILQTAAEYDTDFSISIINNKDFSIYKKPTKKELKSDNPKYCFINTAKFFYDKFEELDEKDRENFIFYIYNNVKMIRITCSDVAFAIKLFQVMNDRGMPLSSADIIKSYIMGRIEKTDDKDRLNQKFNSNWKSIEDTVSDNDLKMDDFMVCYEYFKLRSNPKKQVIDELKDIVENEIDIENIIDEMKLFADKISELFSSTDKVIYSLRYIPWKFYVITSLVVALYVNYPNRKELFKLIRRYFYLAFISGKNLNQIKQTSFKLIDMIANNNSLDEIAEILSQSINKYRMIKTVYENLNGDVFGENYLKPLLLSIEYEQREIINTGFIEINKDLHMDHILPQSFSTEPAWDYIDKTAGEKYRNTLGNMALLHCKKNEEALNRGFEIKKHIYLGQHIDGTPNNNGMTCFDTTKEITDVKDNWNINDIKRRYDIQIGRIEEMLNISLDMIEEDKTVVPDEIIVLEKQKAPRFNFFELGIKAGEKLNWYNDDSFTCEVLDEHNVLWNGQKYSLSGIAKEKLKRNALNGALYFKYKGRVISDIYKEILKQQN